MSGSTLFSTLRVDDVLTVRSTRDSTLRFTIENVTVGRTPRIEAWLLEAPVENFDRGATIEITSAEVADDDAFEDDGVIDTLVHSGGTEYIKPEASALLLAQKGHVFAAIRVGSVDVAKQ
jgi:hypothetical protein